jgi:hypothetical protein
MRYSRLASRCEVSGHVEVRGYTYFRRRIPTPDVGEQKQHEKGSTARGYVHAPRREIVPLTRVAIVTGKTDIEMPAGIAGIVPVRETCHKTPQGRSDVASALCRQVGRMPNRAPRCSAPSERLFAVAAKPSDRFRPCGRIAGLASGISPQNCAGLVGKLPRKCPINPHESVSNELLHLRIAERAHRFIFGANQ